VGWGFYAAASAARRSPDSVQQRGTATVPTVDDRRRPTVVASKRFRPSSPVCRYSDLIAGSLIRAATVYRRHYLAIFELRLEGLRRPALAAEIDTLMAGAALFTAEHHAAHRLPIPPAAIPTMMIVYGGALFALVTGPLEAATPQFVRPLAEAIVHRALHTTP
jgi:hypothetical protein